MSESNGARLRRIGAALGGSPKLDDGAVGGRLSARRVERNELGFLAIFFAAPRDARRRRSGSNADDSVELRRPPRPVDRDATKKREQKNARARRRNSRRPESPFFRSPPPL